MTTDQTQPHLFTDTLEAMDLVVRQVPDDAWDNPSPCEGWTAAHVLSHVLDGLGQVMAGLDAAGAYGSTPSADELDTSSSMRDRWQAARLRVAQGLGEADLTKTMELNGNTVTLQQALNLPTADIAVHVWDLAAATGVDRKLDDDLLTFVKNFWGQAPEERLRRDGVMAEQKQAPADASETDKVMAFLGREVPTDH